MSEEKEDIKKLIEELKELMDGPNPEEVEKELSKNPPIVAICPHCRGLISQSSNSTTQHQFLTISEPSPFREKERSKPKKSE